jgi:hypothetical protein
MARRVRSTSCFPLELAAWLERNHYGEPVHATEHGVRRRFQVRSIEPLLRWLLGLDRPVRIEAPDDVAAAFRALSESTLSRYADPADTTRPGGASS